MARKLNWHRSYRDSDPNYQANRLIGARVPSFSEESRDVREARENHLEWLHRHLMRLASEHPDNEGFFLEQANQRLLELLRLRKMRSALETQQLGSE